MRVMLALWAPWILLGVVVTIVYANSLHGVFLYDDEIYIVENPSIRQFWPPTWAQGSSPIFS